MEKVEWQFLDKKFMVNSEYISSLNDYKRAYEWYAQLGNRKEALNQADKISAILRDNGYPKGCN